jgi:predicted DNA binding protein|tara:strand:- start:365 stop:577 length:213 start_codon:yes stop_codon:yes gene_type:complete
MTVNGIDIVEQLRGRMKFYHVGDPVRKDMQRACEAIEEAGGTTAESVSDWLESKGVKLTPKQRKTLNLEG